MVDQLDRRRDLRPGLIRPALPESELGEARLDRFHELDVDGAPGEGREWLQPATRLLETTASEREARMQLLDEDLVDPERTHVVRTPDGLFRLAPSSEAIEVIPGVAQEVRAEESHEAEALGHR